MKTMHLDLESLPTYRKLKVKRAYDNLTQMELLQKMNLPLHDASRLSSIEKGHPIPKRFIEPINNYLYGEEEGVKKDESIGV